MMVVNVFLPVCDDIPYITSILALTCGLLVSLDGRSLVLATVYGVTTEYNYLMLARCSK
jgi:hypothetical protein